MEKQILIKVRAVIMHEEKMLVVRHLGYPENLFALPGGHLEFGEELKEGLSRELVEELGVNTEIGRLLYVNTFIGNSGNQYMEFFFEVLKGEEYLNTEELERSHAHELMEILWVSPTDNKEILPKKFGEDFKAGKILGNEVRFIKD
jgi:8-oxo-dGTP diphosphatase